MQLGAGARADVGHVDGLASHLAHRMCMRRAVRHGHHRRQARRVEDMFGQQRRPSSPCQASSSDAATPTSASQSRVTSSGATKPTIAPSSALMLHKVMRSAIGSARTALACKLRCLVSSAIHAEAADHVQHHVLGADTGGQPAVPAVANRLRHLQPDAAADQHAEHVGAADAEHEGPEGAARRRMRIAADTEHAGAQMAALRQQHVADAFAVVHMRQLLLVAHCRAMCTMRRDSSSASAT